MAITQTIVDDFDGTQPARTYSFALEGTDYEIDLSETNLGKLRGALAPFITAGRRRAKTTRSGRGRRATASTGASTNALIRTWWAENWNALGLPQPTSHLGPIPARVKDAYRDASTRSEPVADPPVHH